MVELLVVIAIIAFLAGLIVYGLPLITEKKVRGRKRAGVIHLSQ
jgi:type II secretory pathway pseudopilin PulG